jgi:hypothetical protein
LPILDACLYWILAQMYSGPFPDESCFAPI